MSGSPAISDERGFLLTATLAAIFAVAWLASPDRRRIEAAALTAAVAGAIIGSLAGWLVLSEVDAWRLWLVSRERLSSVWAGGAAVSAALGALVFSLVRRMRR
ncbi:MAG: hypothetical protein JNK46_00750 [Methylobacteriaceae bacterium]|nr:hypothetical protein [Methylobacteriaceae bacterium]